MKRTFALILAALAAVALFAGLVHTVLLAAHVADPAATTVEGLTLRRLWATTAAGLALVGVAAGGLALVRPAGRFGRAGAWYGPASGRIGIGVALAAGLIAVINGALNLAVATGGPGSGNGVVGAAGALVLGLIAMAAGGLALARSRTRSPGGSPSGT
jgi:hypothetical protein